MPRVFRRLSKVSQVVRLLGPRWALFRLRYALRLRSGALERRCPAGKWTGKGTPASGTYFLPDSHLAYRERMAQWPILTANAIEQANAICEGRFTFYKAFDRSLGLPPNWHVNPVTGETLPADRHWSKMGDFAFGDIKNVWEQSRFPWVFPLLRAYWLTDDDQYPETFWTLVEDWLASNPPNLGANWKCGQEAAIRAMAVSFGRWGFLGHPASTPTRLAALDELLTFTAERILGNLDYAVSQNNNHGTSEAAVLFGLGVLYEAHSEAARWRDIGETALVSLMEKLIGPQGDFSQHSLNYHRVMLQAILWAEAVARVNPNTLKDASLPSSISQARKKAESYLMTYVQPGSGRVPVFGANDGADLLPLHGLGYADFRPVCLQHPDAWDSSHPASELSWWLNAGSDRPAESPPPLAEVFDTPDHAVYPFGESRLYLRRRAAWRFRPSHADQLHIDVFHRGEAVVVDAGSYSYNDPAWDKKFPGTPFHNTATFDGLDQMPRLSRFLYGKWVTATREGDCVRCVHACGREHRRTVTVMPDGFRIDDELIGDFQSADLRWRLAPERDWIIDGNRATADNIIIEITTDGETDCGEGFVSFHYGVMRPLRVLRVRLTAPGRITTIFRIAD